MDIDLDVTEILLSTALTALGSVVGWVAIVTASNSRRIAVLDERSSNHSDAINGIGQIHYRIDGVEAGLAKIDGQLGQINKTVGMINKYLLDSGK